MFAEWSQWTAESENALANGASSIWLEDKPQKQDSRRIDLQG
jgi:hypothetical protein